jgi:sugar/nucleoside kinase (ribokinase family)
VERFPAPSPPRRILSLGAAVLDTIYRVEEIPRTPTKVLPTDCAQMGSGMASSAAAAAAKLGAHARVWGRVGADLAGRQYRDDLAAAGVDVSQVRVVAGARTAMSTILIDRRGAALVVSYYDPKLGADAAWLPLGELAGFDFVLADTRWPEGSAALLEAARARGVPSLFDADIAPQEIVARLLPLASHTVFSESGLLQFTGARDLAAGLRAAAGRASGFLGATAGERGFHWLDGGVIRHVPAPRVEAVDTLAAGDVFHGAFALMLAEGRGIEDAARFACVAASLKCARFGGRLGAPTRAEVEAVLTG